MIIFKNKDELTILSKINLGNSLKLDNREFENINLNDEQSFNIVLESLKNDYENYWKKIIK